MALELLLAAIIGTTDPRALTKEAVTSLELSKAEYNQTLTSMGVVYCPPTTDKASETGTGVISMRRDTLVTAAHIFVDDNGQARNNLSECYFVNAKNRKKRHMLVFREGYFVNGLDGGAYDIRKDYVIVRLIPPVGEAVPYQADTSGRPTPEGQKVIVIMNLYDASRRHYGGTTLVETCSSRLNLGDDNDGRGAFDDDCTSFPDDSGSPVFTRSATGELRLKGINVGQRVKTQDYCHYDARICSGVTVEIRGPFLADLLGRKKKLTPLSADVAIPTPRNGP